MKQLDFNGLNEEQIKQSQVATQAAFPDFIFHSNHIKTYWPKLEKYFPSYQIFCVDSNNRLIGFMNTIPLHYDKPLKELPDEGWDWLIQKGVEDYENNILPNTLGGLQLIITKENLGKGYSPIFLKAAKELKTKLDYNNFILPIRPTFKHHYPEMDMEVYCSFKMKDKLYDPWIRTHLKQGAEIIKVCRKAMYVEGDLNFWENNMQQKINSSGRYNIQGALNPVNINIEKNLGIYNESNIWISYQ